MTRNALLSGFSLATCLLLLAGAASASAAPIHVASPQALGSLNCTLYSSPRGTYSIYFYGSVSGGVPKYTWTLDFGDGHSTSGMISASGGSYSALHTYAKNGNYTAAFSAGDSNPDNHSACSGITTAVSINGAIQVNATLSEDIVVTEVPSHRMGASLKEMISLTDTALSLPATMLKETIGLVDSAAKVAQNLLTEIVSLLDTGHLTTTVSSTQSSSNPAGGTSPFPIQYIALPVIGVAAVLSFLLLRWLRPPNVKR